MLSPSSRSSITRTFKALVIAAAGACVTGCPLAVLGFLGNWSPVYTPELTMRGDVLTAGRASIKVGALLYFEGTDASGSFNIQQGEGKDFKPFLQAITQPATKSDDDVPRGEFVLKLKSPFRVAQFVVLAWEDLNKNQKYDFDEVRAPETFHITKMDGNWFGYRASGDVLVPLATENVVPFGDATKVKNFRFVMPEMEEPPIVEPPPASPSA